MRFIICMIIELKCITITNHYITDRHKSAFTTFGLMLSQKADNKCPEIQSQPRLLSSPRVMSFLWVSGFFFFF